MDQISSWIQSLTDIHCCTMRGCGEASEIIGPDLPVKLMPLLRSAASGLFLYASELMDNQYLLHTADEMLTYVAVKQSGDRESVTLLTAGPFLMQLPEMPQVMKAADSAGLTGSDRKWLERAFLELKILSPEQTSMLGNMLLRLVTGKTYLGSPVIAGNRNVMTVSEAFILEPVNETERRYAIQNQFYDAVARGADEQEVMALLGQIRLDIRHRVPGDPLRAYKNLSFTTNTSLRIAAERGGVHPVFLHQLSDRMAVRAEQVRTLAEAEQLRDEMVRSYCRLVKQHGTRGLSRAVRKAVQFIHVHSEDPLSLAMIAEASGIHPTHLTRQFRKETGQTVFQCLNGYRIRQASQLLLQTSAAVSEIAAATGFSGSAYFSAVFRKHMGITPLEYRKNLSCRH